MVGGGGRVWEVRAARAMMGGVGAVGGGGRWWEGVGGCGSGGRWWSKLCIVVGGGIFDFIAGLIHSLSDAALL